METVINNLNKKQFKGGESSEGNSSLTVSNGMLPALNNFQKELTKSNKYNFITLWTRVSPYPMALHRLATAYSWRWVQTTAIMKVVNIQGIINI